MGGGWPCDDTLISFFANLRFFIKGGGFLMMMLDYKGGRGGQKSEKK